MPESKSPPFKLERSKTDTDLRDERKKTDTELSSTREVTEAKSDRSVEVSRDKIDRDVALRRAAADRSHGAGAKDGRVQEERQHADELLALEREQADQTLSTEREKLKAAEDAFFAEERHRTDKSLQSERTRTDTDNAYAAQLLTNEQAAHTLTKGAVTTRDEFLAIVSHDLRSPLSIISMCADELREAGEEGRLTELESQWLDTIRLHTASMSRLILDLLDVERMASGSLVLSRVPCNLSALVQEVRGSFQVWAGKLGIQLSADEAKEATVAYADRERVRQLLANLISNALKFTPKGGSVSIRAEQLDTAVHISVSDTGPGIAKDRQDEIFERFSQLKRRDRRGVGLGLFISKWIVESHDGKIWVESELGAGTTFHFTIPRTRP